MTNTNGGTHHSFHVHDVQFQIVDIDGEPPPPLLSGWKDTVWLPEHKTFRLIMRFEDYGMMGQFVVVRPGGSAGSVHDHD